MAKFIGLHCLPGFTMEMLQMARQDAIATSSVTILRVSAEHSTGRVICEVEAQDRESFVAWLNKINMPYDEVIRVDLEMNT